MAGVVQQIDITEFINWARQRQKKLDALDFTVPLKRCEVMLQAEGKQHFARQQDPDGKPWRPLKQQRNRARDQRAAKRNRGTQQVLRDTGRLMLSVTANGPGAIRRLQRYELVMGTSVPYARVHQEGAVIRKAARQRGPSDKPWVFTGSNGMVIFTRKIKAHTIRIPKRQFIGIGQRARKLINLIFGEFLGKQMRGS